MLAAAYLAGIVTAEKAQALSVVLPPTASHAFLLLPMTVSEVRHLLGRLIWPLPRNTKRTLQWSIWRRCHQSRASYFHTICRREAG